MRTQNLWGEERSPSFIFLVYPNTVARVQRTPGQATTHNWSAVRSAVCAPKGHTHTATGNVPGDPLLWPSVSTGDHWVTGKCWGSLCEIGNSFWDGLNAEASMILNFISHFHRGVKPAPSRATPGPEGKHLGAEEEEHNSSGIAKLSHPWQGRATGCQGLTGKLVETYKNVDMTTWTFQFVTTFHFNVSLFL